MGLSLGAMTWLTLLALQIVPLALERAVELRKFPQSRSHLVLGFSNTSSWPVPASLTAEPTQVRTALAHQTPFTHVQLDTFLGYHPKEKVATRIAC